jgi:hypothetical protein
MLLHNLTALPPALREISRPRLPPGRSQIDNIQTRGILG